MGKKPAEPTNLFEQEPQDAGESLFSVVFMTNPNLMAISTIKNGTYLQVNDAFLQRLGYQRHEVIGCRSTELGIWADAKERDQAIKVLAKNGFLRNYRFHFVTKNKEVRFGLANADYIKVRGKKLLLTVISDFTELEVYKEEVLQLNQYSMLAKLAGSIGHEIRNPITTVRGFLQLLGTKAGYKQDHTHFELMISELDRANDIITDFLSLSRHKSFDRKMANINDSIVALMPLINAQALKLERKLHFDFGVIPNTLINEKEIRQVILNLVQNAFEAPPVGGTVCIKTICDSKHIQIYVQDNGCGIEPSRLNSLGTAFLTTKGQGTGLGLSVCYDIIERHAGKIEVTSNENGTTFTVKLPTK